MLTLHSAVQTQPGFELAFRAFDSDCRERIFRAFDRDRSGGLDREELAAALCQLSLSANRYQAAQILAKYDTDCSGVLEPEEFSRLCDELCEFHKLTSKAKAQPQDDIAHTFGVFDVDGSNAIEVAELMAALNALGLNTDVAAAEQILCLYDQDTNGRLDAEEFRRLVTDLRVFHRNHNKCG